MKPLMSWLWLCLKKFEQTHAKCNHVHTYHGTEANLHHTGGQMIGLKVKRVTLRQRYGSCWGIWRASSWSIGILCKDSCFGYKGKENFQGLTKLIKVQIAILLWRQKVICIMLDLLQYSCALQLIREEISVEVLFVTFCILCKVKYYSLVFNRCAFVYFLL